MKSNEDNKLSSHDQNEVKLFLEKINKTRHCCIIYTPTRFIRYDTGRSGELKYRDLLVCDEHYKLTPFQSNVVQMIDLREIFDYSDEPVEKQLEEKMVTIQVPQSMMDEIRDYIDSLPKRNRKTKESELIWLAWNYFENEVLKS